MRLQGMDRVGRAEPFDECTEIMEDKSFFDEGMSSICAHQKTCAGHSESDMRDELWI